MSADLPTPLVGPDVDCSDLDGFMLNAERLMSSELVALYGNEVLGAAVMLWCRAWKQRPAASLPDDDRVNSKFACMPLPKFKRLKHAVMRGFIKCSDGRLYHPFLGELAVKAYERKLAFQKKRAVDAQRLINWRERQHGQNEGGSSSGRAVETPHETRFETHFVADGNGKERERERERYLKRERPPSAASPAPKRGTRLSGDWQPTAPDLADASKALGLRQAENELAKFRDYWPAQPGKGGVKLDWNATWRNWVRRAAERLPGAGAQASTICRPPAEPCIDMGGEFRQVPSRNLPGAVQMFLDKGAWPFPTPKPGEPGCRVPGEFLPVRLRTKTTGAAA